MMTYYLLSDVAGEHVLLCSGNWLPVGSGRLIQVEDVVDLATFESVSDARRVIELLAIYGCHTKVVKWENSHLRENF